MTGKRGACIQQWGFKTLPRYLLWKVNRFYVDEKWTAQKRNVEVTMPIDFDVASLMSKGWFVFSFRVTSRYPFCMSIYLFWTKNISAYVSVLSLIARSQVSSCVSFCVTFVCVRFATRRTRIWQRAPTKGCCCCSERRVHQSHHRHGI